MFNAPTDWLDDFQPGAAKRQVLSQLLPEATAISEHNRILVPFAEPALFP
jgi:hypothetical protein